MVAVNGNSNPTVSDLRTEVARLGQYRLQLAQRLSEAADQLDSPGIVPSELLIDDLRDYRQQLVTLSSRLRVYTTRCNEEIARTLGGDAFLAEIAPELRIPTALHWLVARRDGGTAVPPVAMHGKFSLPLRPEEPVLLVEQPR